MKKLIIGMVFILLIGSFSCSDLPVSQTTFAPTTFSRTLTSNEVTEVPTYSEEWAWSCIISYLNGLAQSPEAIRYLADLYSQTHVESIFAENEVGQKFEGHEYSGWQVYLRSIGKTTKEYWQNLNWAVFKDGFVTEGSNDAMRVKADLIELNNK